MPEEPFVSDVGDDDDFDDESDDLVYLEYCLEGAETLPGLAERLRSFADELDERSETGWQLAEPVSGGWAHLVRGV